MSRPGRVRHRPAVPVAVVLAVLVHAPGVLAHPDIGEVAREVEARAAAQPDDPGLLLQRARVYEEAREWDRALATYAHAAAHGADRDEAAVARARVLLAAGRPRQAKRELDRVIARRPDAWGAYLERGRAWRQLGHPAQASADLGRAVRGLPEPRPEHVLEWADAILARGRRSEAIRALEVGLERTGPAVSLDLAALALEESLERWDAALRRLDHLLATAPANAAWVARRGDVLARAGRTAEARAARARALAMLDDRPARRRAGPMAALAERLRAELHAADPSKGGRP